MRDVRIYKAMLFFLACTILFVSCPSDLVPAPVLTQIQSSQVSSGQNSIAAPSGLSATNGHAGFITLSWNSVSNAVQYQIFAAESLFSDDAFKPVSATYSNKNATSINIKAEPGRTFYFKVRAIGRDQSSYADSLIVRGSTLAVPEITDVSMSSEGNAATVNWWMSNCTADTYLMRDSEVNIVYHVEYDTTESFSTPKTLTVRTGATSARLEDLVSDTPYFIRVSATTLSYSSEETKSEVINSRTAKRLIPDGPADVAATQGTTTDSVAVSWTAPPLVWVRTGSGAAASYELHPLYFTIERKPADAADSAYTVINEKYSLVTVPGDYSAYEPGATLSWADATAVRGRKYTYRVWAHVDDVAENKRVESATAHGEADGWLVALPGFTASSSYQDNGLTDGDRLYTSIDVAFDITFETFGLESYAYILSQSFKSFDAASADPYGDEVILGRYDSLATARSAASTFAGTDLDSASPAGKTGYYKYTLYIVPAAKLTADLSDIKDNPFAAVTASGSVTVTDNPNLFADISSFTVADGFSNKFVLSWEYIDKCKFGVSWTAGAGSSEQELTFSDDQITALKTATEASPVLVGAGGADGKLYLKSVTPDGAATPLTMAVFEHAAASGDSRVYTLHANSGIEITRLNTDGNNNGIENHTLGTAEVQPADISYNTLTVTWPQVQKADSYGVSLVFDDAAGTELIRQQAGETPANYVITESDGICTCVITKPEGWNDISKAGKPMTVKVAARNAATADETLSDAEAVTLVGPALVNARTGTTVASDSMTLSWNGVSGAGGYLICRLNYADTSLAVLTEGVAETMYYYSVADGTLTADDEAVPDKRAAVRKQNTADGVVFTLTDRYTEADDATVAYQKMQSRIVWGLPYGYVVIPVKDASSAFSFSYSGTSKKVSVKETEQDPAALYSGIVPVIASTTGYGLAVMADKAENGRTVHLTWTKPYASATPYVYRRPYDSTTNQWEYISLNMNRDTSEVYIEPVGTDRYTAYEYAVVYGSSGRRALAPSYVDMLEKTVDARYAYPDGVSPERANKGYLLAVRLTAGYGGVLVDGTYDPTSQDYYSEKVEWDPWDYSVRALGPDSCTLALKNKNISADWKTVDAAGSQLASTTVTGSEAEHSYKLYPQFNADGYATGSLTVLRDYKHYYRLTLSRNVMKDGAQTTATAEIGGDESVWAYRQIKKKEMARIVGLIIADVFTQKGVPGGMVDESFTLQGNTGSFKFTHYGSSTNVSWGTDNTEYRHVFLSGMPGTQDLSDKSIASIWSLKCPMTVKKEGATFDGKKLYALSSNTIVVKSDCPSEVKETYEGTVTFEMSKTWGLKMSVTAGNTQDSNATVNTTTESDFKKFMPFNNNSDSYSSGIGSAVNTAYPQFAGDWWGGQ